ncbi:sam-dependent methyltransferase [Seminavis robusta]|uniref:Sam-dependent methyltransferase n=1 Tax=Seminavis robusta TaxID=568900 RepID=A0A9N8E6H0_9STRA|nr:sam-dependent methyltransferase [Seminavis robusta]|eukprot:Sro601_g173590.1 sam-dependent methyltransferase (338) ;mRNA; r:43536-44549
MRALSSVNPWDRLWPSVAALRTEWQSCTHLAGLPEGVQEALRSMTAEKETHDNTDLQNLHRIGVLTRRINTFLEQQLLSSNNTKKTSEAVYTPMTLDAYDALVWDFNAPFHWRIQRQEIDALYQKGLAGSKRHCEVAVGTGLFLRQWARRLPQSKENATDQAELENLTLMDLSPSSLEGCYQRLQEEEFFAENNNQALLSIDKVQANIQTLPPKRLQHSFDSVAANFLLHCLHGKSMQDKSNAIRSCASLLNPQGVFFGSTILGFELEQDAVMAGPYAIQTNQLYNELGIFGNRGDTFADLTALLEEYFDEVDIVKVGYCAVWLAKNPKRQVAGNKQ